MSFHGADWAQLRPPPSDAGRDMQALLRWKYTPGWVPLSTLHSKHRRLSKYTRAELEHAARNARRHGSFRFSVRTHEGRTVIRLNQEHRRYDELEQESVRSTAFSASHPASSESSSDSDDFDRTTVPEGWSRQDQSSTSTWDSHSAARDHTEPHMVRGPASAPSSSHGTLHKN